MLRSIRHAVALAALFLSIGTTWADEQRLPAPHSAKESDWSVTVGAGGKIGPTFEGARGYRFTPFPNFDVTYRDTVFVSTEKGLGVNVFNMEGFKAGPLVKYKQARSEKDDRHLAGLGDVAGTVEGGAFVRYSWRRFLESTLEIRNGIKGHGGLVIDWDARTTLPIPPIENLYLTVGPRLSASNRIYNTAYFGVDSLQAGRSGYAIHRPGAGLRRVGGELVATYRLTEALRLSTFFDYDRLLGDTAGSPLVKGPGGSANQFTLGSTLTYSFD